MLIDQIKPVRMPVAEQLDHIRRVQAYGDEDSWNAMLAQFMPIIKRYACRFGSEQTHEIREADLLLRFIRCMKAFDPDAGIRPSTYFFRSFAHPINMLQHVGPIRSPMSAWTSQPEQYAKLLEPTVQIDRDKFTNLPVDDDPVSHVSRKEELERLEYAISILPNRMRDTIRARLAGNTLEQTGEMFGVTRERIRQIESKAKERIRETLEKPIFLPKEQKLMNDVHPSTDERKRPVDPIDAAIETLSGDNAIAKLDKRIQELQEQLDHLKKIRKAFGGQTKTPRPAGAKRRWAVDEEKEAAIVAAVTKHGKMKPGKIADLTGIPPVTVGIIVSESDKLTKDGYSVVLA